jgi:hypothetical protein
MTPWRSCDRRARSRTSLWLGGAHERDRVGVWGLPPRGGFAGSCVALVGGPRSRVCPAAAPASLRHLKGEPPLLHRCAGGAVASGCLDGSRLALDRASSYPLISRGLPGLLRVRREITGRACARRARSSHSRDRESRATDTRVRPVPAVAMRGRCVSVADDTAERPVHARTRSRAARRMRGRRWSRRADGRMIGSTMVSHRRHEGSETTNRAADAPGESTRFAGGRTQRRCDGCTSIGTRLPAW